LGENAPLVSTSAAPVPGGAHAQWFTGAGGARLRAALFPAAGEARGSVVLSPGRTEPIEKYFEVAEALTARGFVTLAHDWRGQGLADRLLPDRLLGHAAGYQDFLTDYAALLATYETRLPQPWIGLGHSMGGCLALLALAEGERRFAAAILSAPMLGIRVGAAPPMVARALASALTKLGRGGHSVPGSATVATPFEANIVTHDPVRYARAEGLSEACPDLALGLPTWGWLDFAFVATTRLAKGRGVPLIDIPVTVVAAGDDRLVDNTALRQVTARLPRGRYVEIPGAFHELLQESDDVQTAFWREFDALAAGIKPASEVGRSGGFEEAKRLS
jgi:lysophospholipase